LPDQSCRAAIDATDVGDNKTQYCINDYCLAEGDVQNPYLLADVIDKKVLSGNPDLLSTQAGIVSMLKMGCLASAGMGPGEGMTCTNEFFSALGDQLAILLSPFAAWQAENYMEASPGEESSGVRLEAGMKRSSSVVGVRGFRGCSFDSDTQVVLADGSTKPIAEIDIGDQVLATDPETGRTEALPVTEFFRHDDVLIELALDGGDSVTTTEDHPFWNASDGEWQQAQDLDRGDLLLTADGTEVRVHGLDWTSVHNDEAYNLTVGDIHTYYVVAGSTPVLVHNANPACQRALRGFQSEYFHFGNNVFLLDKRGMEHILTRHHPTYWDGTVRNIQTFFNKSMSVDEVRSAVRSVMLQNRATLMQNGTNGAYQIRGSVNGVEYVLGVNTGRVGQFYPLP
jgi:hypothetical protein